MKTLIILVLLFFSFAANRQENYKISRYEQSSIQLFICINHIDKPVYVEHFFTEGERSTADSIKLTIEGLLADLEIKADEYFAPEIITKKESKGMVFSKENIVVIKARKLLKIDSLKIIPKDIKITTEILKIEK